MDASTQDSAEKIQVLCVDDEQNVLNSLRRMFAKAGYKALTANSGFEGLAILSNTPIDIIISDMRMPKMDGAEFLTKVSANWPNTIRILLTGYADFESTIDAINQAGIYSYINKPWEDKHLLQTVSNAAEHIYLKKEQQRLQRLTQQQNKELQFLNEHLEELVDERTHKLLKTSKKLEHTLAKLEKSHCSAIPVFSHLINLREHKQKDYYDKVTSLSQLMLDQLYLSDKQEKDIYFASLLHNIGKLTFPDNLAYKALQSLTVRERNLYEQYPQIGSAALTAIEPLLGCRKIILSHKEKYNGSGFPNKLQGEEIILGARILGMVVDYFQYQLGMITEVHYDACKAQEMICNNNQNHYDPRLIDIFESACTSFTQHHVDEKYLSTAHLKEGMVLSRSIITANGVLVLPERHELNQSTIESLLSYEEKNQEKLNVYVR